MISIANDKDESVVKEYLKKEKVDWINLFDNSSDPVICNKFKIQSYPTFILIDPSGKIIKRAVGKEGLISIKQILSKIMGP